MNKNLRKFSSFLNNPIFVAGGFANVSLNDGPKDASGFGNVTLAKNGFGNVTLANGGPGGFGNTSLNDGPKPSAASIPLSQVTVGVVLFCCLWSVFGCF
jgi:hypothetical protein